MENTMQVVVRDEKEQSQKRTALVDGAASLPITTDSEALTAGEYAKTLKAFITEAEEYFAPEIEQAHKLHKSLTAKRNAVVDPVKAAFTALRDRLATFQLKRQREQEEKERKAREAAEAKEAKIKADLAAQAEAARQAGDHSKAESIEIKAENTVVAARTVAAAPKIAGVAVKEVWELEVLDPNKVPVKWWNAVDEGRLKRAKTADPTMEVPGVKFYKKAQGSVRGGK